MDEARLRALLNHAVSAEPPAGQPLGRIDADSRRGGRRLRRRRRAESAAASIASVAVVAAAVSFASGTFGHTHNQSPAGDSGRSRGMAYVLTFGGPAGAGPGAVVPVNLATMRAGRPIQKGLTSFGTFTSYAVVAAGGRTLYVAAKAKILLISTKTGKIERAIRVAGYPAGPDSLLAGANGKVGYAEGPKIITPVDLVTGSALRPVSVSAASQAFGWVAVSRNGKTLLTAGLRAVTVVTSDRAKKPIRLTGPLSSTCVAVSPDGATGYLLRKSLKGGYSLLPIDVAADKPLKAIQLRGQNYDVRSAPCTVAVTPNGRAAYVQIGRYVAPIDLVAGKALRPIRLPAVSADFDPQLSIDPDGKMAYAIGENWVFPVDLATHRALPAVRANAYCLSFSPDGRTVLVGVGGPHNTGKLLLIHAATGKAGQAIRVPGTCASIAVPGIPSTALSP